MNLCDIDIIDLRHSKWDEKLSRPHDGYYVWIDRQKINYKIPGRPDWRFEWIRFEPRNGYRELREEKVMRGFEPVIAPSEGQKSGFDPFVPEGAEINSQHYYQFGDLVLCKCPLDRYLARVEEQLKLSSEPGKRHLRQFDAQMKAQGTALPPDVSERLMD